MVERWQPPYYAYVHVRPNGDDAHAIFYVGKGFWRRANSFKSRNRHYGFVLNKHGAPNLQVGVIECSNEETAFALETGLIKCLRRMGVELTNQTDGGEGRAGHKLTLEQRHSHSIIMQEVLARPEAKAKHHANLLRRWRDEEYRAQMCAMAQSLWDRPGYRERHSIAVRKAQSNPKVLENISIGTKAGFAAMSPEDREAWLTNSRAAQKRPEVRAKKSASGKAARASPEARAIISATGIESWKNPARRKATSKQMKGRMVVTDGVRMRYVKAKAAIPRGWWRGIPESRREQLRLQAIEQSQRPCAKEVFVKRIKHACKKRSSFKNRPDG
jgi:hypothetical protein